MGTCPRELPWCSHLETSDLPDPSSLSSALALPTELPWQPSLKCSGDVACHRFSREGHWWAQWHSSERWPQWGQPTWRKCLAATRRPRWGRSFTTLQPWWPSRPTVQPSPGPTGLLCIHLGDGMLEQPSQPDGFATCWILQGAPACWVWGDWQLLLT